MKITFVGGGSLVWGTMVLTDMVLTRHLRGTTIVLQDIDQAGLELMARMGRKLSQQGGAGFTIDTTTDLQAAVAEADVVVDCVGIGGFDAMRADFGIPARYALEGDRRKALQALCYDPALQRRDIAAPLLDEMLRATAACLPQFR